MIYKIMICNSDRQFVLVDVKGKEVDDLTFVAKYNGISDVFEKATGMSLGCVAKTRSKAINIYKERNIRKKLEIYILDHQDYYEQLKKQYKELILKNNLLIFKKLLTK